MHYMTEKQFEKVLNSDKIVDVNVMSEQGFMDKLREALKHDGMDLEEEIKNWDKEESTIEKDFNRGLEVLEQMRKQGG